MLPKRKDLLDQGRSSEQSSKSSSRQTESTIEKNLLNARGQKRKSDDVHEEKGSEFLRRKHNFVRSTIRVDYQPDICKDYKETGFCGFGDSCKFLHDRSDYKHGWQLEQEWKKGEYKDEDDEKYLIKDEDESDEDSSVCPVCSKEFDDPIVTKCKHYFCGSCADKRCSDKCFSCGAPTSGIFKVVKIEPKKSTKEESSSKATSSTTIERASRDANESQKDHYKGE